VFYLVNTQTRNTVFGYGLFKFPESALLLDARGRDDADAIQLRFRQPSRQITVFNRSVTLNPYSFVVNFTRTEANDSRLRGEIWHPDTKTLIGETELTPWLG
jgi:hypothetical protein